MTTPNERMAAALRRERAAYVRLGKTDRVDQVDEQLRHLGYANEPDEPDGPDGSPPEGRTAQDPAQHTAAEVKATAARRRAKPKE